MTTITNVVTAIVENRRHYAQTDSEITELIRTIVDDDHGDWPSLIYVCDRPLTADNSELPGHQLRVMVEPGTGYGALNWFQEGSDGDARDSFNPHAPDDAPRILFSPHSGTEFRQNAALPIDLIRTAIDEFIHTGQRPTCVHWQLAEWY
ncbi:hypothetical protein FHR84_000376 [Actinopolyspora biskrensis]|uniref:Immunity protein Imm1 n=1 Tax=Actinopolyspora biskrensis TaxID=1470178 RepID=A0A852YTL2_9ACTN|nr:Imm1 family immunity protein [Actinopolyspora biskrensis]NYH77062.1 hypothetical protein [Actinopolyspora biskrensis]